jgi:hypothetical protein
VVALDATTEIFMAPDQLCLVCHDKKKGLRGGKEKEREREREREREIDRQWQILTGCLERKRREEKTMRIYCFA